MKEYSFNFNILITQNIPMSAPMIDTADMDPELARYLNRNYWQQRSEDIKTNPAVTQPSAPVALSEAKVTTNTPKVQEVRCLCPEKNMYLGFQSENW